MPHKETIQVGQLEIKYLLEAADTGGLMTVFEFFVPQGAKVPAPHYHETFDEVIYGLEGAMTFTLGDKTMELGKGQSCFVPRGIVHGFDNLSSGDAKALAITTPGLLGPEYFIELAAVLNAGGPPDMEKVKLVFKKYGLVPVLKG